MADEVPEMPSLTVDGGPLDGYEMKMSPGTTVIIGSGRLAHMRLDHPDIELAHVKVAWDDLGIQMVDNGSRKGTWVNGEPVETAALLDGDVIEFVAPGGKSTPPKVRIKIPRGSVPEAPPPPPPPVVGAGGTEGAAPARAAVRGKAGAKGRARRRGRGLALPDLRVVGLVAGGLLLLGGGGWLAKRLFWTAPQIDSVRPARAEPGQTITLTGARFARRAEDNTVWFGDRQVTAASVSGGALEVRVPAVAKGGALPVSVETASGRSRPASFAVLMPLKAVSADPAGALPGDEVVLRGSGFEEGATVSVGGAAATVRSVEPALLRFEMPAIAGTPGSLHAVVVTVGGRGTAPLQLYLGRVPIVVSFEPPRGVAGDLVRIRGAGFSSTVDGNAVTFDGVPALVVAANAGEMAVVVPPPVRPQPETLAPVVVHAGGRSSSEGAAFPLQRLVEGTWVPRFLAGAVGEGGSKGQATVGTEIAPVLLLAGKDDARSVPERALRVAAALNAVVGRARVGEAAGFEARDQPIVGVAAVGAADVLLRVTPEDAAAYETPPGLPPRGAPPTAIALARHWAALLTDTLVVGTSGAKPQASAGPEPQAAAAFARLRTALPWQYGTGVASARVVAVPGELRRALREGAFRVP
jgi:hypothetical protein